MNDINKLKDKIVYDVLLYIDNPINKSEIQDMIKQFAKFYHVPLIKTTKNDIKQSLLDFILNEQGYNETLPRLVNSF